MTRSDQYTLADGGVDFNEWKCERCGEPCCEEGYDVFVAMLCTKHFRELFINYIRDTGGTEGVIKAYQINWEKEDLKKS